MASPLYCVVVCWGVCWDNGKDNGSYYSGVISGLGYALLKYYILKPFSVYKLSVSCSHAFSAN